jgi:hypothetical protein
MAGQVIHYNVTMPEQCFPIIPTGKRRETRCDIPQFGLRRRGERKGPFRRAAHAIHRPQGDGLSRLWTSLWRSVEGLPGDRGDGWTCWSQGVADGRRPNGIGCFAYARSPTAPSGRRSKPTSSAKVAATRIIVNAAPEKMSPRSVSPKMATGSVTQPGG